MNVDRRQLFKQNIFLVSISLALVGCIGLLLYMTYASQLRIRDFAMDQLRQDAEKRAGAVSYFYLERRDDLKTLSEQRALAAFFENQALGMSMRYGLEDSLLDMARQFEKLLDEKRLGGERIYARIIFKNEDGTILVERSVAQAANADEKGANGPEPSPPDEGKDAEIRLAADGGVKDVVATIPYYFKGRLVGRIIATIATDAAYDYLLRGASGASLRTLAVGEEGGSLLYAAPGSLSGLVRSMDLHVREMIPGETARYRLPEGDGAEREVIAVRAPIRDTPFYLLSLAPSEEILGGLAPAPLLFLLTTVSSFIFVCVALTVRMNTRRFVLQARLDESAKARAALKEKNMLLQKEIEERLRAEASLRNSEERLRESEERFRALSEATFEAIFLTEGGVCVGQNLSAEKMFGYSTEEALGRSAIDWFAPDSRELVLNNSLSDQEKPSEASALRKDGTAFPCEIQGKMIVYGGRRIGVTALRDITERKVAEEERRILETRLQQAQKMEAIGTLAGGIAHDFNNILGAILGYTEMVLADLPEESAVKSDMEQILKAGHRAKDLVKQILVFSRMKAGDSYRKVDVGRIVKEILLLLRASLPSTIEIRSDVGNNAFITMADPTQIHELLINICTNAGHAMEEKGGVLDVSLEEVRIDAGSAPLLPDVLPGRYLRLTVSDTGHGMDAETMEHIFEPYFTTKAVGKGTGFGLAVVHGIINRHGGAVTVHSEPGKGATFQTYLPVLEGDEDAAAEMEGPVPRGTERILFVDDEEVLAGVAQRMLERIGYRVLACTSSVEALDVFRARPDDFDLVVTDYTMPRMTGADLAREMLAIRPDASIVLCTGFSERISEETAREIGIREFAMKPLDRRSLASIIRKALEKPGS